MALQRIVLHSKMDSQFSRGRGGRQRTYKQCIIDALDNFGVTMAQCMDMGQQDWDLRIEGIGLETAAQRWEARPKASTPIDKEWRTAGARKPGQTAATASAEQVDGVGSENAVADDDSEDGESETEDEFAQFQESQEHTSGRADEDAEDMTPWEGAEGTKDRDKEATTRRTGARHRNGHMSSADSNKEDRTAMMETCRAPSERQELTARAEVAIMKKQGCVVEQRRAAEERYGNATGAHQDGQRTAEQNSHPGVENEATDGRTKTAKRKVATANRNCKRDRKRAREISIGGHHQNQRDLQLIIGEDLSAKVNRSGAVPWEHRGILGHTREGREQERDIMDT